MAADKKKKKLEKRFLAYVVLIKTGVYIIIFILLVIFVMKAMKVFS